MTKSNVVPWIGVFPDGSVVKNLLPVQKMQVWSLSQEDPLEEEMATHSSILAWEIPWTDEPGRRQSMGSQSQTRLNNETTWTGSWNRKKDTNPDTNPVCPKRACIEHTPRNIAKALGSKPQKSLLKSSTTPDWYRQKAVSKSIAKALKTMWALEPTASESKTKLAV